MNYSNRLNALRASLRELNCETLAVTHLTNVRYLCGFTGTSGMLLVGQDSVQFITDFRYQVQAAQQVGSVADVTIADKGLWKKAAELIETKKTTQVGFEAAHTSVSQWREVQRFLGETAQTVETENAVENLRACKDDGEMKIIREAVRVADEAFAAVLPLLRPGVREIQIADAIEREIRARGGSGTSFDTIVASGVRSSLPHGVASEKELEAGDMVTIDMGAAWGGYCSDMTRTVCLGKASEQQKAIYELVYRAQVAACEALKPGLECVAADQVARDIINAAGHTEHFGHGLGHGVGMDIHEAPRLSPLGKGTLAAGMVVTSEPGIYIADFGGVRVEDMLLITNDGAEILTGTPKPPTLLEL